MPRVRIDSLELGGKRVLQDIDVDLPLGELVLLAGATGSGKTSLLNTLAGLVPDFTGGRLQAALPDDLRVSLVQQSPRDGFVADTVAAEVGFGLEVLSASVRGARIAAAVEAVGIAALMHRQLKTLSGGEHQRVAIAAALAAEPDLLLLDEPTSALDPVAADEVLGLLQRLAHDHAIGVLFSEHRFDRAVHFADRIMLMHSGSALLDQTPALVGCLPLPPITVQLSGAIGLEAPLLTVAGLQKSLPPVNAPNLQELPVTNDIVIVESLTVKRADLDVLRGIDLNVGHGEVVGLFGRNGVGKSTLLHALFGDLPAVRGRVSIQGKDPSAMQGSELLELVSILPHQPIDLLLEPSVAECCSANDKRRGLNAGSTYARLVTLAGDQIDPASHPREISEGERLQVALALCIASGPTVLLLDEPTRGLDQVLRARLVEQIRVLASEGCAVVVATHDLDWAAEVCDRGYLLDAGRVIAADRIELLLSQSRLMAPTVARVFWPLPIVNISAALAALGARREP